MTATTPRTWVSTAFALFMAFAIACAGSASLAVSAYAETTDTNATPDELQQKVEDTAKAYDEAATKVTDLQAQIDENEARISEVEALLPQQREKSASAIKTLYKLQQDQPGLVELLLSSDDFNEFITSYQYIQTIRQRSIDEATQLQELEDELNATQAELQTQKSQADAEEAAAEQALSEAQAARQEAQEKAAAQAAAEEAAAQAALAEAAASSGTTTDTATTTASVSSSVATVDWGTDKTAFVSEWTPRIDNYLAGSPLAGQGATFASAAWDYGVDPRWSPAISNTESSKGLYCFASHNAWGWGSSSWSTWEEAIYAHVAGLSAGYGYTLSVWAAQKYCPPNWANWYADTLSEMNSI